MPILSNPLNPDERFIKMKGALSEYNKSQGKKGFLHITGTGAQRNIEYVEELSIFAKICKFFNIGGYRLQNIAHFFNEDVPVILKNSISATEEDIQTIEGVRSTLQKKVLVKLNMPIILEDSKNGTNKDIEIKKDTNEKVTGVNNVIKDNFVPTTPGYFYFKNIFENNPFPQEIAQSLLDSLKSRENNTFIAMTCLPDQDDMITREMRSDIALAISRNQPIPYDGTELEYVSIGSGGLLQDFYNVALWVCNSQKPEQDTSSGQTINLHFIDNGYNDEEPVLDDGKTKWKKAVEEFSECMKILEEKFGVTMRVHLHPSMEDYSKKSHDTKIDILSGIRIPEPLYHPRYKVQQQDVQFGELLNNAKDTAFTICLSDRNALINLRAKGKKYNNPTDIDLQKCVESQVISKVL